MLLHCISFPHFCCVDDIKNGNEMLHHAVDIGHSIDVRRMCSDTDECVIGPYEELLPVPFLAD